VILTHTAKLPHGYSVSFTFREGSGEKIAVEWKPEHPDIGSHRAWRKFWRRYEVERDAFVQSVADRTRMGCKINHRDEDGTLLRVDYIDPDIDEGRPDEP